MHPQVLSIGDFFSFGDSKWLYWERSDKTEELAEELRAEELRMGSSSDKKKLKPFVERLSKPPSKAEVHEHEHIQATSKIAGVWESVKVGGMQSLEVISLHVSFSAPRDLYNDFYASTSRGDAIVPREGTRKSGDSVGLGNREGT
ncbi:hypothetical protein AX14_002455 [Amanita brunnescens Koide BX004]|nr:hypothetical protein AX14_002455 [Amanita brunnescens Koide BX004]